jgi:hypothetical protein
MILPGAEARYEKFLSSLTDSSRSGYVKARTDYTAWYLEKKGELPCESTLFETTLIEEYLHFLRKPPADSKENYEEDSYT